MEAAAPCQRTLTAVSDGRELDVVIVLSFTHISSSFS